MAPARFSLTSSNTLGSLKCDAACTIAFARFSASAGSANSVEFFMKMPEPTNTASTPADASLVMQLGAEAGLVGSGVFIKNPTGFPAPRGAEEGPKGSAHGHADLKKPKGDS